MLIDEINALYASQLATWPLAEANFSALSHVRSKGIDISGFKARVQFNPARAASSGAKVDARSIAARPCFLCRDNRPPEQSGITIGDFEILVNPYPIFHHHFTIPLRTHTPQSIAGRMCHLMAMAWQMPGYTVFYNGPRCGASAPDHHHFQAVPSECLPIWDAIPATGLPLLYVAEGIPYATTVITSTDFTEASAITDRLLHALPSSGGEEPPVNILCRTCADAVQIAMIPRRCHRPSIYGRMMISPGTIDMAGVLICPVESDYHAMDSALAGEILSEVGMPPADLHRIISNLP